MPMLKSFKRHVKSIIYTAWPITLAWGGRYSLKRIAKTLNKYNITLDLDLSEAVDRLYAHGLFSIKSVEFLIQSIEDSGSTWFVDAGANLGFYSFAIAKHFSGSVQCLSIEPDPYSQAKISQNKLYNPAIAPYVHLAPYALDKCSSTVALMINDVGNRGGSSVCIDQRRFTGRDVNLTIDVPSNTLQAICLEHFDENISWCLKIDIEGYEYPVLETFFNDASRCTLPSAIVAEWTGQGELGPGGETPIELLIKHGYSLVGKDGCENYLLCRY